MEQLPDICGSEQQVAAAMASQKPVFLPDSDIDFGGLDSAFAIALHMHQPLIPAGGDDPRTARVISNLEHMLRHPDEGDNHNAPVFQWCYRRMRDFIAELVDEGRSPRVMLDYSGCLLHGLRELGAHEVIDALRQLATEPRYRRCVEWLGTAWGHPVAPSTPAQDFRLHVRAWQHHFASLFGLEALARVRGFSPPEMAVPNHPDVCFEFVRTLKECGYRWVLVQEHTVEDAADGGPIRCPHLPHRLLATNSRGETAAITAVIKTQGSDTKLVAQMQPCYEARSARRSRLGARDLPSLVTQIGDGENGGVMMNEFPSKYMAVMRESSGSRTPPMNVTEYLEFLSAAGVSEDDFPPVRPIMQKRIWDRLEPGGGPEALQAAVEALRREDGRFHMEGGSWTNNISWMRGYEKLLGPMEKASAAFAGKVTDRGVSPREARYRNALFHLMLTQTSCFRYWGEGRWTEYGRELCRRAEEILEHDL